MYQTKQQLLHDYHNNSIFTKKRTTENERTDDDEGKGRACGAGSGAPGGNCAPVAGGIVPPAGPVTVSYSRGVGAIGRPSPRYLVSNFQSGAGYGAGAAGVRRRATPVAPRRRGKGRNDYLQQFDMPARRGAYRSDATCDNAAASHIRGQMAKNDTGREGSSCAIPPSSPGCIAHSRTFVYC